jgi:DNA-binding beta-propeller fold protein YncE
LITKRFANLCPTGDVCVFNGDNAVSVIDTTNDTVVTTLTGFAGPPLWPLSRTRDDGAHCKIGAARDL